MARKIYVGVIFDQGKNILSWTEIISGLEASLFF